MLAKLTVIVAATAAAQTGAKLTDPQIAHIAYTAGQAREAVSAAETEERIRSAWNIHDRA
jgi:predicted outer membrane protein